MAGRRNTDASSSSSGGKKSKRTQKGSSCGIKSLNQYGDWILKKEADIAEANAETGQIAKAWAGAKATDHKNGHYSTAANAGAAALTAGDLQVLKTTAGASAEVGVGGAIVEANADAATYSIGNDDFQMDVGKGYVGGGLGAGPGGVKAKVEAGVDLADVNVKFSENQGMDLNVGLNVNTGVEAGVDGVSASFLGFGFSAGRNTGLSTPFGGISFKLW